MPVIDPWGRTILNSQEVFEALYNGKAIVDAPVIDNEDVRQYVEACRTFDKTPRIVVDEKPEISPGEYHSVKSSTWNIPEKYKLIDIYSYLSSKTLTDEEINRVAEEMSLFEEKNFIPVLRLMIYLVDFMRENKIVWGVGRGSSVASYVLYLIGIHKVDSIKYNLDIKEFLK